MYDGEALPADVYMTDVTEAARNPSRFMAMEGAFIDEHPDRRVRIVSQLAWPGRTEEEFVACIEHEALVNTAMDAYPATSLCLYDASAIGDEVLMDARATHPLLWKSGALHRSPDYAPNEVLQRCNQPLAANPGAVTYMVRKSADLRPARSFAVDYAGWMGLSQECIEDLQLVATELATNSLMYTGAPAGWPSGKTTDIWCARPATPDSSTIRWWAASTRVRAARQPRPVLGQRHFGLGAHAYRQDGNDNSGVPAV